jgi:Acetyltransferase (GNAT) domain
MPAARRRDSLPKHMTTKQLVLHSVQEYHPGQAEAWDDLVARSCNGTMMHTRRFIAYHSDRFRDRSLVLTDRRGRVAGVFPAADDPADQLTVISHPGLSYGGLVHDGSVRGAAMLDAMAAITSHYRGSGSSQLRYKAVPAIYHSAPADDDIYALFRLGANRYRCDLSAAIDLSNRGRVSPRRSRSRKKAETAGVSVQDTWPEIAEFWQILGLNLASRHRVSPVHSLDEIQLLHDQFPDDITLIVAKIKDVLVGGAVFFASTQVLHMQYTATTDEGRATSATDLVMERGIALALERGCRYFDFGVSMIDGGRSLDDQLYQFKVAFGAGGIAQDFYELDLR